MNRRNNSQNTRIPDLPPKTRYSNLMNTSMSSNKEKKFMKTEAQGFKRNTNSESRVENKSPAANFLRNRKSSRDMKSPVTPANGRNTNLTSLDAGRYGKTTTSNRRRQINAVDKTLPTPPPRKSMLPPKPRVPAARPPLNSN